MKCQVFKVQENIPLAPLTTFKIGGPAKFFAEVEDEQELAQAIKFAHEKKLAIFIMGAGSNVVISDAGFDGMVIRLKNHPGGIKTIARDPHPVIECWAGESLSSVVNYAAKYQFSGLEWATGIPGTVGGAVRGNAGAYGSATHEIVRNVRFIDINKIDPEKMQIESINCVDCDFSYRHSLFKDEPNLVIVSATFELRHVAKEAIDLKTQEIIKKRTQKIPTESSSGSFFKNPVVSDEGLIARFERDCQIECRDKKIPAAWLIEEADLKGMKIGRVQVSQKHANFVVNLGGAKAEEVVMLASLIKQKVRTKLGVQLQEEVQYVGF